MVAYSTFILVFESFCTFLWYRALYSRGIVLSMVEGILTGPVLSGARSNSLKPAVCCCVYLNNRE
jgi:hypothetical protein